MTASDSNPLGAELNGVKGRGGRRGQKVSAPDPVLAPLRLGMLSEEAVPRADSVLAALAKHLEVKLAFGATARRMKAKMKAWTPVNAL